jgi:hypothetical protein
MKTDSIPSPNGAQNHRVHLAQNREERSNVHGGGISDEWGGSSSTDFDASLLDHARYGITMQLMIRWMESQGADRQEAEESLTGAMEKMAGRAPFGLVGNAFLYQGSQQLLERAYHMNLSQFEYYLQNLEHKENPLNPFEQTPLDALVEDTKQATAAYLQATVGSQQFRLFPQMQGENGAMAYSAGLADACVEYFASEGYDLIQVAANPIEAGRQLMSIIGSADQLPDVAREAYQQLQAAVTGFPGADDYQKGYLVGTAALTLLDVRDTYKDISDALKKVQHLTDNLNNGNVDSIPDAIDYLNNGRVPESTPAQHGAASDADIPSHRIDPEQSVANDGQRTPTQADIDAYNQQAREQQVQRLREDSPANAVVETPDGVRSIQSTERTGQVLQIGDRDGNNFIVEIRIGHTADGERFFGWGTNEQWYPFRERDNLEVQNDWITNPREAAQVVLNHLNTGSATPETALLNLDDWQARRIREERQGSVGNNVVMDGIHPRRIHGTVGYGEGIDLVGADGQQYVVQVRDAQIAGGRRALGYGSNDQWYPLPGDRSQWMKDGRFDLDAIGNYVTEQAQLGKVDLSARMTTNEWLDTYGARGTPLLEGSVGNNVIVDDGQVKRITGTVGYGEGIRLADAQGQPFMMQIRDAEAADGSRHLGYGTNDQWYPLPGDRSQWMKDGRFDLGTIGQYVTVEAQAGHIDRSARMGMATWEMRFGTPQQPSPTPDKTPLDSPTQSSGPPSQTQGSPTQPQQRPPSADSPPQDRPPSGEPPPAASRPEHAPLPAPLEHDDPLMPGYTRARSERMAPPEPLMVDGRPHEVLGMTDDGQLRLRPQRQVDEATLGTTVYSPQSEWTLYGREVIHDDRTWQFSGVLTGPADGQRGFVLIDPTNPQNQKYVPDAQADDIRFRIAEVGGQTHSLGEVERGSLVLQHHPYGIGNDAILRPLQAGEHFDARLKGREAEGAYRIEVGDDGRLTATGRNRDDIEVREPVTPQQIAPTTTQMITTDFGAIEVDTFIDREVRERIRAHWDAENPGQQIDGPTVQPGSETQAPADKSPGNGAIPPENAVGSQQTDSSPQRDQLALPPASDPNDPMSQYYARSHDERSRLPEPEVIDGKRYDVMGVTDDGRLLLMPEGNIARSITDDAMFVRQGDGSLVGREVTYRGETWRFDGLSVEGWQPEATQNGFNLVDPLNPERRLLVPEAQAEEIRFALSQDEGGEYTFGDIKHGVIRLHPAEQASMIERPLQPGDSFEARLKGRELEGVYTVTVGEDRQLIASGHARNGTDVSGIVQPGQIASRYERVRSPDFGDQFEVDAFAHREAVTRGRALTTEDTGLPLRDPIYGNLDAEAQPRLHFGADSLGAQVDFIRRNADQVPPGERPSLTVFNIAFINTGEAERVVDAMIDFRRQHGEDAQIRIVGYAASFDSFSRSPEYAEFDRKLRENGIEVAFFDGRTGRDNIGEDLSEDNMLRQVIHAKGVIVNDRVMFTTGAVRDVNKADITTELPADTRVTLPSEALTENPPSRTLGEVFRMYMDEAVIADASDARRQELASTLAGNGVLVNDPVVGTPYIARAQDGLIRGAERELFLSVSELRNTDTTTAIIERARSGVDVEVQYREIDERSRSLLEQAQAQYPNLKVQDVSQWDPRPHYNVIIADGMQAYVGTAYLWPNQQEMIHHGRSFENGVLVEGDAAVELRRQMEGLRQRQQQQQGRDQSYGVDSSPEDVAETSAMEQSKAPSTLGSDVAGSGSENPYIVDPVNQTDYPHGMDPAPNNWLPYDPAFNINHGLDGRDGTQGDYVTIYGHGLLQSDSRFSPRVEPRFFEVPPNVTIYTMGLPGAPIAEAVGMVASVNADLAGIPLKAWRAGELMPDVMIYPPDNLQRVGNPIYVDDPNGVRLSDLINERQLTGNVVMAACQDLSLSRPETVPMPEAAWQGAFFLRPDQYENYYAELSITEGVSVRVQLEYNTQHGLNGQGESGEYTTIGGLSILGGPTPYSVVRVKDDRVFKVPEGTDIYFSTPVGGTASEALAETINRGEDLSRIALLHYGPGQAAYDPLILPGTHEISGNAIEVTDPKGKRLSEVIAENGLTGNIVVSGGLQSNRAVASGIVFDLPENYPKLESNPEVQATPDSVDNTQLQNPQTAGRESGEQTGQDSLGLGSRRDSDSPDASDTPDSRNWLQRTWDNVLDARLPVIDNIAVFAQQSGPDSKWQAGIPLNAGQAIAKLQEYMQNNLRGDSQASVDDLMRTLDPRTAAEMRYSSSSLAGGVDFATGFQRAQTLQVPVDSANVNGGALRWDERAGAYQLDAVAVDGGYRLNGPLTVKPSESLTPLNISSTRLSGEAGEAVGLPSMSLKFTDEYKPIVLPAGTVITADNLAQFNAALADPEYRSRSGTQDYATTAKVNLVLSEGRGNDDPQNLFNRVFGRDNAGEFGALEQTLRKTEGTVSPSVFGGEVHNAPLNSTRLGFELEQRPGPSIREILQNMRNVLPGAPSQEALPPADAPARREDDTLSQASPSAIRANASTGPRLDEASHPHHAMFANIHERIGEYERGRGIDSGEFGRNVAGALTASALDGGLREVHHVVFNAEGTRAFAVNTPDIHAPWQRLAYVDVLTAGQQSLQTSSERIRESNLANSQDQTQQQAMAQGKATDESRSASRSLA